MVFGCKRATLGQELHVSVGPRPQLSFCACKTAWLAAELLVYMGPSRHLWFLHAKQRLLDQNYKSLWVLDLTWRFVHAKQRLWTRITSLYAFKVSSLFLCIENSAFRTKIACLYGSQTSPVILFMQNRVPSIGITSPYGSCPHLWFLHAKQRLLDPNNKSLWVPDLTCRFVQGKQHAWHQNL